MRRRYTPRPGLEECLNALGRLAPELETEATVFLGEGVSSKAVAKFTTVKLGGEEAKVFRVSNPSSNYFGLMAGGSLPLSYAVVLSVARVLGEPNRFRKAQRMVIAEWGASMSVFEGFGDLLPEMEEEVEKFLRKALVIDNIQSL